MRNKTFGKLDCSSITVGFRRLLTTAAKAPVTMVWTCSPQRLKWTVLSPVLSGQHNKAVVQVGSTNSGALSVKIDQQTSSTMNNREKRIMCVATTRNKIVNIIMNFDYCGTTDIETEIPDRVLNIKSGVNSPDGVLF